ncbi:helix-turn-helix domain-containing protein [Paraurantiacibacter namhicola]|uniref:Anaerobic benzoate catabolism transcriptional regulator n=1 Tax=Paraurantiacibacter namhicola TaxID=645517 RepID=A0A1C7D5B3_9SPHN|nr:helix-turn-helix transcriptional regulator [Paraurantiacibacter namhicola]ANU06650.1 anaerobic benzoate catabolism transcriptional regulator [Paraurantiacibacter namhicola]
MARKAIYMGPRMKRVRRDRGLTQANMAEDLGVSPSYIALMERNQRPVTAELLLNLATTYGIDIADLADGAEEELGTRLEGALRDPIFADIDLPALDAADIATSYPGFAEAFLRLQTAFEEERLALAERMDSAEGSAAPGTSDPVGEARAFLAARQNCFPALDASAAELASELGSIEALSARLQDNHGLEVRFVDAGLLLGALRFLDYHRRRLLLNERLDLSSRRFQLALQVAILEQGEAIAPLVEEGRLQSEDAAMLVRRALQSYWAGALIMPYRPFLKAARELRYDVEALAGRFGTSFEQVAHRLTTLRQPGEEGIPFFFLRVDRAGNVSKRLDGAGFPFARHGGACPLWNVHHAFAAPGQVIAQEIELPDGERYVSIARTVKSGGGAFDAPAALRSVALACPASHSAELVYSSTLEGREPTPIGVACRLCHRPHCIARSAPPMGREMSPTAYRDTGVPFAFSGE